MPGYEKGRVTIGAETFYRALPNDEESIEGMVYELSFEELKKVDQYEGDEYKRTRGLLKNGISAWFYVKTE